MGFHELQSSGAGLTGREGLEGLGDRIVICVEVFGNKLY